MDREAGLAGKRRSPSGERGLKFTSCYNAAEVDLVAPHPGSVD